MKKVVKLPTDEEVNIIVDEHHTKWHKDNPHFTIEQSQFYWSGINDGAYALINKLKEKAYEEKPFLGLATTSELIYELSARCDTGSIDKGGKYKTVEG